jgi:hypothetical protein
MSDEKKESIDKVIKALTALFSDEQVVMVGVAVKISKFDEFMKSMAEGDQAIFANPDFTEENIEYFKKQKEKKDAAKEGKALIDSTTNIKS